jgi:hypothetical protein
MSSDCGGKLDEAWIYMVGPVLGALVATVCAWLLHRTPNQHEKKAADGQDHKQNCSTEI